MSVTDPLIKDLKGCVQQLYMKLKTNEFIGENDFYSVLLCKTIETILSKGLKVQQNSLYLVRNIDPFTWMSSLLKDNSNSLAFSYRNSVETIKECPDVQTNAARLRLLIKSCLIRQCLHVPVEFLIKNNRAKAFYKPNSIVGDEILREIFLSTLLQISKIKFVLDLKNCSFLNSSWYIPDLIHIELVPCKCLGLSVSFSGNRAVIVAVEAHSVVSEQGRVRIGDVLDKLNDVQITNAAKGRLNSILRKRSGQPVSLTIAQAYNIERKEFYEPIKSLLIELKLDLDLILKQYHKSGGEDVLPKRLSHNDFHVAYLGCVDVGSDGNVKQVHKAMKRFFKLGENEPSDAQLQIVLKEKQLVAIEVGEIGVKIKNVQSSELIMEHSYMQISSCGSLPTLERTFAYIAGKENCDVANEFFCHIFEANTIDSCDTILHSLVQGFRRTHFAV